MDREQAEGVDPAPPDSIGPANMGFFSENSSGE
jgi:hypothetical protein